MKSLNPASMLVLAALAAAGCRAHAAPAPAAESVPGEARLTAKQVQESRIAVETVSPQPVTSTIALSGKVSFHDLHVAHVFPPVTGRVVEILAEPGQHVAKGQALAIIDSPDLGMASADQDKALADFQAASHEAERQKGLYAAHAGSQRDFETANDNFLKARAELARAREKMKLLRAGPGGKAPQQYALRSPIDGDVLARNVNPAMEVQGTYSGGQVAELFTVGSFDPVWVVADVYEMDVPRVRLGDPVRVRVVAYPDETFTGVVDWVSGTLDPVTRTMRVRCSVANPDRKLLPEMYATAEVDVDRRQALAVPRNAILRHGDRTVVFVEEAGGAGGEVRFEARDVVVDDRVSSAWVPVTSGLKAGDRVVGSGAILLSDAI